MTRRVTDSALSADAFEALSPHRQLTALLDMIDRYLAQTPGGSIDPWHAAKLGHALVKIDKGEVDAAAHDLALADQAAHGAPEDGAVLLTLDDLRAHARKARHRLASAGDRAGAP